MFGITRVSVAVVAVVLTSMMGAAVTTLMPLVVGALTQSRTFSEQQIGFLAAGDMMGILLVSVSSFFWVRRVNWQLFTLFGLGLFVVCNHFSSANLAFNTLLLLRVLAGIGCGISYAISIAALGDFKQSDRAFSAMVTSQVVFGTAGFWILPTLIETDGFAAIFHFFNWFLIPAWLLAAIAYPKNQKTEVIRGFRIDGAWWPAVLVFGGTAMYYFAQGTAWAYLERIGVLRGLSEAQVGQWLGLGFAISAAGSVLTPWVIARWGRRYALWLTALIQVPCIAALCLMNQQNVLWIYAIATIIYQLLWSFIVPIMMSIFNDADRSGRLIVFCLSAFKTGLVVGPPVAGLIVTYHSEVHVLWAGAVAIVVSVIMLHFADARLTRVMPLR